MTIQRKQDSPHKCGYFAALQSTHLYASNADFWGSESSEALINKPPSLSSTLTKLIRNGYYHRNKHTWLFMRFFCSIARVRQTSLYLIQRVQYNTKNLWIFALAIVSKIYILLWGQWKIYTVLHDLLNLHIKTELFFKVNISKNNRLLGKF